MKKKTNKGQKSMGAIIMEICIIMKQKREGNIEEISLCIFQKMRKRLKEHAKN